MEHSAQADFHGGLGRKGSWRAPFVFYIPAIILFETYEFNPNIFSDFLGNLISFYRIRNYSREKREYTSLYTASPNEISA
jgi:hypothetical protein